MLGHAGGGDGFALLNLRGDLLIEGEELDEQILFRTEAVGGEYSGVERGVGVFQRIRVGPFEGAME